MTNCDFSWTSQLHAPMTDSSHRLQQHNSREYEVPLSLIGEHKPVRATGGDKLSLSRCLSLLLSPSLSLTQPNYQTRNDRLALGKHKGPFFLLWPEKR